MRVVQATRAAVLATILAVAGLAGAAGESGAQGTPFSVRGQTAGELPAVRSPDTQQRIAEEAARNLSPANPATGAAPAGPGSPVARPGPAPFDINQDGRAPVVAVEDEVETIMRPSTTISPLANGRQPTTAMPVDAISEEQRRDLSLLLKQNNGTVRELRVNVESSQEWVDSIVDRPIVPYRTLRLDGEYDSRSWSVFLSAAEAARGGTLSVAFTNSVLVLPEPSRLRIYLNGREIAETAIDSPDRTKVVALPVSSGVLRPGQNAIRLVAEMRHRIDCSIGATFELWTRIDTRLTGFTFEGGNLPLANLNDLPAVGVSTNGATRLRIIQPNPASPDNVDRMLRAVQAASLRGRFVQPLVEVVNAPGSIIDEPGVLNIVIGLYDTVRTVSPFVPREGAVGPVVTLVDNTEIGPTVILTGPTVRDVDTALTRFEAPRLADDPRPAIAATPPWLAPESVRVDGARTVTLAEAGVDTINFSGRRFEVGFQITLPPDFYAAAYGEARLLLDAAYSAAVEPGSRVLVFVNGILSTAISFTSSSGEILDDFPIVLVMQSFRPGINDVEIVVELNTEADRACLPGGTVPARDRFALFSSTRLVFPDFARIGQLPNLASFATNGFPYQLTSRPVRVRVGGDSLDSVGAAGTLIARVAVSRGASLPTNVVEDVTPFGDGGVIVVSPLSEVSNATLAATGANQVIPAAWLQAFPETRGAEPEGLERYDDVLRRLRQQLRQEEVRLDRTAAEADLEDAAADGVPAGDLSRDDWFEEIGRGGISGFLSNVWREVRSVININLDLGRGSEDPLERPLVPETSTLVLAQGRAPDSDETAWTLLTAPTPSLLSAATAALTSPEIWNRIGGRVTAYDLEQNTVEVVPATDVSYIATLPLSFTNMRLIAANWFSINNGVYAIALVLCAVLLGIVTWALITPLGRSR